MFNSCLAASSTCNSVLLNILLLYLEIHPSSNNYLGIQLPLIYLEYMEISHFAEDKDHETIDKSIQTPSILPKFHSSCSSDKEPINPRAEPEPPHEALFFVLAYLPVFELLAISEVCRSFKDAVNKDVLPWLEIIVEKPLNSKLSDEILMKITSKSNGRLRTLALTNSVKITDDGLQRVVEKNPFISKLHLPACTGLTPQGIIRAVKTITQNHNSLSSLKINSIYNMTKEHLETLCSNLPINPPKQKPRPILYHLHRISLTSRNKESDRLIDVEICPKCNEVRLVFDCPREECKSRDGSFTDCKGCNFCVPRCEECGGCVDAEELDEAACTDILCSYCWLHLPKCDFCNKPYCKQHSYQQFSSPDSTGFACEACNMTAIRHSGNDV